MSDKDPATPEMGDWKIDYIQRVAAASDIVDVIGGYLPIMRSNTAWRATCPFHRETTSSLYISPQRQAYYCFGCGSGGSVFKFIMEYERIDFDAALDLLAKRFDVLRVAGWHMDAPDARGIWEANPIPGVDREQVQEAARAAFASLKSAQMKTGGRP